MPAPTALRERYELSPNDLAEATGANLRTVRKWDVDDDVQIQERFMTRLAQLDSVLDVLADFKTSFIQAWLREPSDELDGLSPREALGAGRWSDVLHYAQVTVAGVPPKQTATTAPAPPPLQTASQN
jgi:hypothetical protein